jgi:hypothetical protein
MMIGINLWLATYGRRIRVWILEEGEWNDSGSWIDAALWKDNNA